MWETGLTWLCGVSLSSAKSDYINLILPRKGLPTNTSLDQNIVRKYVNLSMP